MTCRPRKMGSSRSEQIRSADINDASEKRAASTRWLLDSEIEPDHHSVTTNAAGAMPRPPQEPLSRMTIDATQKNGLSELKVIMAAAQLVWHPNLRLHKITRCPNDYVAFSLIPADIDDGGQVHPTDPAIITVMDADPERAMSRAIDKALSQIEQSENPLGDFLETAKRR